MKSLLKHASLSILIVSACLAGACAAPTDEDADQSEGAATDDESVPADPPLADYGDTPLFGGRAFRAFAVKDAAGNPSATLWISRDGAFTVLPASQAEAWNGTFRADSTKITLAITNHGDDQDRAAQSPYQGEWSYTVAGDTIDLAKGTATFVLSPLS
jgi:hypothetical protein